MSDSAPNPSRNSDEGGPSARWFGLSLAFHLALLGALIFLVPAKEIRAFLDQGQTPETAASPERLREVSRQIEDAQAGEVRRKLEELLATERELSEMDRQAREDFSKLAGEMSADAAANMADSTEKAMKAQDNAVKAQTEALKAEDAARNTGLEKSQLDRADAAQEQAKRAQEAALAVQANSAQQLALGEEKAFAEAKAAQAAALAAQEAAKAGQDRAAALLDELRTRREASLPVERRLAELRGAAGNQSARVAEAQNAATAAQAKIQEAQAAAAAAAEAVQAAESRSAAATNDAALAAALEQARKQLAAAEENVRQEQGRADVAQKDLASQREAAGQAQAELGRQQAAVAKSAKALEGLAQGARDAQANALAAQQKAREAQAVAQGAAGKAGAQAATSRPGAPESAEAPAAEPDLNGRSLSDLYGLAVETENRIASEFQSIRATELAVMRQIPLSEARKYVEMARPTRPDLALSDVPVESSADLEERKEAIEKVLQELESMLALTRGMAGQAQAARDAASGSGGGVTVETLKSRAAQSGQLAALATDKQDGNNAADLTGIMKAMGEAAGGVPGGAASSGKGPGSGPPSGDAGVPRAPAVENSVPGRKVHASGTYPSGAQWMYVNSWYVIGPFPNPDRRNIETKFPPESVVDLDATYPVEGGTVRWQFVQNQEAAIHPPLEEPYKIYYAYTTLWFDEERDLWLAVGSDDFSKLWINDLLVWASGPMHKSWRPDEGFRRVHFKKGLNRLLYRIENGQHACMFSLMLKLNGEP